MSIIGRNSLAILATLAGLSHTATVAAQAPEIEPNSTKSEATAVTLSGFSPPPANQFTGFSIGSVSAQGSTDPASIDTWRIRTVPAPLGIYRHQLVLTTSGVGGHSISLRGLNQTAGVIGPTDSPLQVAAQPARTVVWYGFGNQEEIYCRIQGASTTTAPYVGTLTSTQIIPTVTTGLLVEGTIDIRIASVGAFLIDSDIWLYDSALNAISGAGNDDEFGTPMVTSRLIRSLAPGVYTLAVGRFNLANNLPSPTDDDFRSGVVLDFPNAIVNSQVNPTGPNSTGLVDVVLSDGVHPATTVSLNFAPGTIGDVQFLRFTVAPVGVITGACCTSMGACMLVAGAANCPTQSAYLGDQTTCMPSNPCPQPGSCCTTTSCCFMALQSACAGAWNGPGSTCATAPCWVPVNDSCLNAETLVLGTRVDNTNCDATSSADGPPSSCSTDTGRSVWFAFTPPATAMYRLSTCGSNQDCVLQVFTTPNCVDFTYVACDDDTCDGISPPGSNLAADITAVNLVAGQRYLIRLSTFGQTPTGAPFTLILTASNGLGACCNALGSCMPTDAASCAGMFILNATCTPSPCPQSAGICCRGATCAVIPATACAPMLNAGATFVVGSPSCTNTGGGFTCCLADYDKLGNVTINDIFSFLNDWFAGSPTANFGTDGTLPPPDVNSIFGFLNAWFAGCP